MAISQDIRLILLGPDTAALWFALDPPSDAIAPALDHVRQVLAGGLLRPCLLAVAQIDGMPVGRFQAALDQAGCLGVWTPQFREDLDTPTQQRAAGAFLRECLALVEARGGARYAETELPDSLDMPAWRAALEQAGFARVGSYRLYDRVLAEANTDLEEAPLAWRPADTLPEASLAELLGRIRDDSLDRVHQLAPESASEQLHRLKTLPLLSPDQSAWRVGFLEGRPAGLVFSSLENEAFGTPDRGWIVEIGVAPDCRGRGLSKHLLARGLADLRERGARSVRARIDDENTPSIRLHTSGGFEAAAERWAVLWRPEPTGLRRRVGALWRALRRPPTGRC